MDAATILQPVGLELASIFFGLWWLWFFMALLPVFMSTWHFYKKESGLRSVNFVVLELRMPRQILQGPRAAEQILMALHSIGDPSAPFSLEIESFGGEVHFYLRCNAKQKGLVEAAIFSYYPDVEVAEVADYVSRIPANVQEMQEQDKDMWGTEMILAKSAAFPIRTYKDFEAMTEEREFDPMAALLETLAKIKDKEIVAVQFVISPLGSEWRQAGIDEVNKLKESKTTKTDAGELIKAFSYKTPGETDVIKAIESNISRPAFECVLRIVYVAPKSLFFDAFAKGGVAGAFNQYSALNLNAFKGNGDMVTRTNPWAWPYFFADKRLAYKKQRLLYLFRNRRMPVMQFMGKLLTSHLFNFNTHSKSFTINTECLATVWHAPTMRVLTAPHVKRVESKKAGPPAGLAIYAEEKELEGLM